MTDIALQATSELREWLIYNGSNGKFWGPNSGGYFGLWGAGLYTETEARRLAQNKDRLDRVHHISEYRDQIEGMRGAFERLHAALEGEDPPVPSPQVLAAARLIGSKMLTQDNRDTLWPVYVVQERRRIYSLDVWEAVAVCFTEGAANTYIAAQKRHLKDPRVYVKSGHCNPEWQAVATLLRELGGPATRIDAAAACQEVCRALDEFQTRYQANAYDWMPGNEFYAGQLLELVRRARVALGKDPTLPPIRFGESEGS